MSSRRGLFSTVGVDLVPRRVDNEHSMTRLTSYGLMLHLPPDHLTHTSSLILCLYITTGLGRFSMFTTSLRFPPKMRGRTYQGNININHGTRKGGGKNLVVYEMRVSRFMDLQLLQLLGPMRRER